MFRCVNRKRTQNQVLILGLAYLLLVLVVLAQGQLFSGDFLHNNNGGSFQRNLRAAPDLASSEPPLLPPEHVIIPLNYNVLEPPPGSPTFVNFSVIVISVRGISEIDEEFTLEMNLRFAWKDERLGHFYDGKSPFVVLNHNLLGQIWHPDVYLDHAIKVEQPVVISKPASLRIYPQAVIRYSARLTVTMSCKMDFHYYPIDTQHCGVQLKSYAYPSKITLLTWDTRGVFFSGKLDLPSFDVDLHSYGNFTFTSNSGTYSNLEFVIALKRNISYQLIQTYLPSLIFLFVSWLSFLIPRDKVQERIGCCLVTLLSLTVMFGSVGQNMPKVTYLTALHIWMSMCIIFVFMAMCEFTVVLKLYSTADSFLKKRGARSKKSRQKSSYQQSENGFEMNKRSEVNSQSASSAAAAAASTRNVDPVPDSASIHSHDSAMVKREKLIRIAKTLEKVSKVCLPCLFLVFNWVYWPWLIVSAGK